MVRYRYAREVIDLLAALPGREWRMHEIVRHVSRARHTGKQERERIRKGVRRALQALIEVHVVQYKPTRSGGATLYRWKVSQKRAAMWDNAPATVAPAALASQPDEQ